MRTDHSAAIKDLRDLASTYDGLAVRLADTEFSKEPGRDRLRSQNYQIWAKKARAMADLIEIHDATGLNLHNAPNILEWILAELPDMIGPVMIQNNGV